MHTSGEWEWDGSNAVTAGNVAVANLEGDPMFWGDEYVPPDNDAEVDANGRLIAASPNLLEACEKIIRYRDDIFQKLNGRPSTISENVMRAAWNIAAEIVRAAVAKAKHGPPEKEDEDVPDLFKDV